MCKLARVCLLVVACLLSLAAQAQVAVISGQAISQDGQPLPNVQVRVCSVTSTGVPCSPTAQIYQDYGLTVPAPNPTTTDNFGNYTVYAGTLPAPNLYTVQYSPASGITWAYVYNGPFLSTAGGTVTGYINALGYNGVPEADQCSGVDAWAKINTCAGMIPNGGVIDARGFGSTTQTVTTPLTALSLPTRPITLELNPATVYISNVVFSAGSIAAGTACMIPIAQGSALETPGFNEELNIRLGPSAATYDVLCNATQDGTQQSFRVDGLGILGNPSATLGDALVHVKNTFVGTEIDRVLTFQPYGTALNDEGGSDHFYLNDNWNDSATTGNYTGSVVNLTCATDATFIGGGIQDNGPHNPLLTVQGHSATGPSSCPPSNPAIGNHFVNVDFEIFPATVGSFSGAATNVDPIQCLDCSDFSIDKLVMYGFKGVGQQHLVDFLSSGAHGQPRGPVEVDNIQAIDSGWDGLPLITNNATGFVSPAQASVIGQQNGCCVYAIGKYRWEGNGTSQASSVDYEDFKNFSSMTAQITNQAYSPIGTNLATAAAWAVSNNGSILIPSNYTGTDTLVSGSSSLNTSNFRVDDQRAFNPANSTDYVGGPMPSTTVKAAEYGAICNGTNDDFPAIQAAANALVDVVGIVQSAPQPMNTGTIELPQGRCTISSPIVLTNYGSIEGSANGTWLTPGPAWSGDGALVVIAQSYAQSGYLSQGVTTINRFVRDINFYYNAAVHNITGVQVINPTGHSSAQPYPTGAQFALYQLPGVRIEGNTFYAMDTAIDFEDCAECVAESNQIFFVRDGIIDSGNNYSLRLEHNAVQAGSYNYTRTPSGPTLGIYAALETRWIVVSSTPTNSLVITPQGLDVGESIITTFDQDLRLANCQGCDFHDDGFDFGGDGGQGSGTPNPTVYVGTLNEVQFHNDLIANNQTNGIGMEIVDANSTPVDSFNLDGLWIESNYFQNYSNTGVGIQYDTGTHGRRNNYIDKNQFSRMTNWVTVGQPLGYSVIRDNYGFSTAGAGITLNAAGSTSFTNTNIEGNTTSDAIHILVDSAGGGFITGWNQAGNNTSVVQLTGTFLATGTGCTIAAGAVGNDCSVTMTNPIPFGDTAYKVGGCNVTNGNGINTATAVSPPSLGTQFTVVEVALSTTATGGGIVTCTVHE